MTGKGRCFLQLSSLFLVQGFILTAIECYVVWYFPMFFVKDLQSIYIHFGMVISSTSGNNAVNLKSVEGN